MSRNAATIISPPRTMPELTLTQARTLVYWHEQTKDDEDGLLDIKMAVQGIHYKWGFIAYDDIDKLRNEFEVLGRWGKPDGFSDQMMIYPYFRENPTLIYEALRKAEEAMGMEKTENPYEGQAVGKKGTSAARVAEPRAAAQAVPEPAATAPVVQPAKVEPAPAANQHAKPTTKPGKGGKPGKPGKGGKPSGRGKAARHEV